MSFSPVIYTVSRNCVLQAHKVKPGCRHVYYFPFSFFFFFPRWRNTGYLTKGTWQAVIQVFVLWGSCGLGGWGGRQELRKWEEIFFFFLILFSSPSSVKKLLWPLLNLKKVRPKQGGKGSLKVFYQTSRSLLSQLCWSRSPSFSTERQGCNLSPTLLWPPARCKPDRRL